MKLFLDDHVGKEMGGSMFRASLERNYKAADSLGDVNQAAACVEESEAPLLVMIMSNMSNHHHPFVLPGCC
jgi:hypothetical protein